MQPVRACSRASLLSAREHPVTEIQPNDSCASRGDRVGDVAGAATKIEREIVRAERRKLEQSPFPESVQTQALQVVN